MPAIMSAMQVSSAAAIGGWNSASPSTRSVGTSTRVTIIKAPASTRRSLIRIEAKEGMQEAVDRNTKVEISRDDILRNQEENQSEKQSVFGSVPSSGGFYPRPEIERRPETGDRSLGSIFAFDGAAPETINGRMAMIGFVWALLAEKATGLGVLQQVMNPGAAGLVNFVSVVQIFTFASIVPILKGESTDARRWGPFRALAERWNGRLAMIGFAALIIDEAMRGIPFISALH
ncbi:hypothetical protein Mapa_005411 [Marchantia paleacea]|nr:hypothetical protein Mapa_005411 [Marchantia paleacea]